MAEMKHTAGPWKVFRTTDGEQIIGIGQASIGETQGFVTSDGRFVRREPAVRIAKKSGQIIEPKFNSRQLFSEDLW